jgi:large subunit ribosomal protein L15
MKLHDLKPAAGSHRKRRRIGRGLGSGRGTTAGKGTKGQKARAGGGVPPFVEGGQTKLVKKLPVRRGFTNIHRIEHQAVNLSDLGKLAGTDTIDVSVLVAAGLLKNDRERVKVLGTGDLDRAVTVTAHKFSATARQKIEAAGGACHALEHASGAN